MCDPIRHMSSNSSTGVCELRIYLLYLLTLSRHASRLADKVTIKLTIRAVSQYLTLTLTLTLDLDR